MSAITVDWVSPECFAKFSSNIGEFCNTSWQCSSVCCFVVSGWFKQFCGTEHNSQRTVQRASPMLLGKTRGGDMWTKQETPIKGKSWRLYEFCCLSICDEKRRAEHGSFLVNRNIWFCNAISETKMLLKQLGTWECSRPNTAMESLDPVLPVQIDEGTTVHLAWWSGSVFFVLRGENGRRWMVTKKTIRVCVMVPTLFMWWGWGIIQCKIFAKAVALCHLICSFLVLDECVHARTNLMSSEVLETPNYIYGGAGTSKTIPSSHRLVAFRRGWPILKWSFRFLIPQILMLLHTWWGTSLELL